MCYEIGLFYRPNAILKIVINCAVNIASNGADNVTGLNVDLF